MQSTVQSLPDVESIRRLPTLREAEVTPDFIDENNHMNIRFYLELNSLAVDALVRSVGIDDAYRAERRLGAFTVEHHLRYYAELRLGDRITVHPQLLACSARGAHMMSYLLDADRGLLANTLEVTYVHVDMDARRSVPMPDDVADGFDRILAQHQALGIVAPVCGAMGVRS